uniref:uncharacterized protein LOC120339547 n=1 Tax=Styela clava TaxID=7725 RepID=UPI00193970A6|nr:uncharacterized protein LOC120339547 [Styela clava]
MKILCQYPTFSGPLGLQSHFMISDISSSSFPNQCVPKSMSSSSTLIDRGKACEMNQSEPNFMRNGDFEEENKLSFAGGGKRMKSDDQMRGGGNENVQTAKRGCGGWSSNCIGQSTTEGNSPFLQEGQRGCRPENQTTTRNRITRINDSFTDDSFLSRSYNIQSNRRQTFTSYPTDCPILPDDLAKAGFVYTGSHDQVKCYYCRRIVEYWGPNEDPSKEKWHRPGCKRPIHENNGSDDPDNFHDGKNIKKDADATQGDLEENNNEETTPMKACKNWGSICLPLSQHVGVSIRAGNSTSPLFNGRSPDEVPGSDVASACDRALLPGDLLYLDENNNEVTIPMKAYENPDPFRFQLPEIELAIRASGSDVASSVASDRALTMGSSSNFSMILGETASLASAPGNNYQLSRLLAWGKGLIIILSPLLLLSIINKKPPVPEHCQARISSEILRVLRPSVQNVGAIVANSFFRIFNHCDKNLCNDTVLSFLLEYGG